MQVTIDLKLAVIIAVLVALFILLIVLIRLALNAIVTIKKVNDVLDDSKRITAVTANQSEKVDNLLSEASDTALNFVDTFRGNTNLIAKAGSITAGAAAAKSIIEKFRTDDEEEYAQRARERRAKKARRRK